MEFGKRWIPDLVFDRIVESLGNHTSKLSKKKQLAGISNAMLVNKKFRDAIKFQNVWLILAKSWGCHIESTVWGAVTFASSATERASKLGKSFVNARGALSKQVFGNRCVCCLVAKGRSRDLPGVGLGTILCETCRELPHYKLICKSTAVERYDLKPEMLDRVPSMERNNPHYRCAAPMQLFLERRVALVAKKVHGTDDVDAIRQKREERVQQRVETQEKNRRHRAKIAIIRREWVDEQITNEIATVAADRKRKEPEDKLDENIYWCQAQRMAEEHNVSATCTEDKAVTAPLRKKLRPTIERAAVLEVETFHVEQQFPERCLQHSLRYYVRHCIDNEESPDDALMAAWAAKKTALVEEIKRMHGDMPDAQTPLFAAFTNQQMHSLTMGDVVAIEDPIAQVKEWFDAFEAQEKARLEADRKQREEVLKTERRQKAAIAERLKYVEQLEAGGSTGPPSPGHWKECACTGLHSTQCTMFLCGRCCRILALRDCARHQVKQGERRWSKRPPQKYYH